MNQRVVIGMALAKDPRLLILDEPTTGLDATVEAELLDLVAALRQEFGTSVLFISHNLDVILRMYDCVGVLYAGRVVETGPVEEVFHNPRHPYTVGLLRCIPRAGARKVRGGSTPSPASCRASGPSCPGACSPNAAPSPRTSATARSRRRSTSVVVTAVAATSTRRLKTSRERRRLPWRSEPIEMTSRGCRS
jgi:peptide/nickel transport system ATP-binding protein